MAELAPISASQQEPHDSLKERLQKLRSNESMEKVNVFNTLASGSLRGVNETAKGRRRQQSRVQDNPNTNPRKPKETQMGLRKDVLEEHKGHPREFS